MASPPPQVATPRPPLICASERGPGRGLIWPSPPHSATPYSPRGADAADLLLHLGSAVVPATESPQQAQQAQQVQQAQQAQQAQQQQAQQQQQPHGSQAKAAGAPTRVPSPLLTPVVASRAARELASIEAALRSSSILPSP